MKLANHPIHEAHTRGSTNVFVGCAGMFWDLLFANQASVHGERYARESIFDASSSPMICSVRGSHRIFSRFSRMAMLPRWQIVIERWATSTGAAVGPA